MSVDSLMYIKEDLIIPHVSFLSSLLPPLFSLWKLMLFVTSSQQHYTFCTSDLDMMLIPIPSTDLSFAALDDFIVNKYRGKSGPMFNFDVHEDIRLTHDAAIEKDEVSSNPFFSDLLFPLDLILTTFLHSTRNSLTQERSSRGVGTTGTNVSDAHFLPPSIDIDEQFSFSLFVSSTSPLFVVFRHFPGFSMGGESTHFSTQRSCSG